MLSHIGIAKKLSLGWFVNSLGSMSAWGGYFGDELVTKIGIETTASVLEKKKFVGVYFG